MSGLGAIGGATRVLWMYRPENRMPSRTAWWSWSRANLTVCAISSGVSPPATSRSLSTDRRRRSCSTRAHPRLPVRELEYPGHGTLARTGVVPSHTRVVRDDLIGTSSGIAGFSQGRRSAAACPQRTVRRWVAIVKSTGHGRRSEPISLLGTSQRAGQSDRSGRGVLRRRRRR